MPLRALSDILWRERELLEQLLFKLEVEQLFLVTGRAKRLPLATREVEEVLETIRLAEVGRSIEVDEAAIALGLPTGVSLLDLANASPAPWDGILLEHRKNFVRLTAEVSSISRSNRDLLASSHRASQETLMSLREGVHTYDPTGVSTSATFGAQLLDETF
ncbi:flagellar protein FlgN [Georgenia yuyongxinii]|uniref:Flagellar protein FlgN n=1 Tax=Georgenia yuyongxinii TaxID=2589797 RepID=A0A5B8C0S4_9MICO|nr:flagellar protein FlgN [Georgenia yuyongxinii]QDC23630.1 flagellar protein FlgN [Georgenia yuyongxinii]